MSGLEHQLGGEETNLFDLNQIFGLDGLVDDNLDNMLQVGENIFGLDDDDDDDDIIVENLELEEPQDLETKRIPICVNYITYSVQLPGECTVAMHRIMTECLSSLVNEESSKNLLIEFPIECERRRAMLAAILAFLHHTKDQTGHKYKIIYAAKSFEEISHVFTELEKFKRIDYLTNLNVAVLSGKGDLCVNDEVLAAKDDVSVDKGCENLLHEKHGKVCSTCRYYPDTRTGPPDFQFVEDGKVQDIEDLMTKGKELEFCPYFLNKNNQKEADFIVCTQEFIVSPLVRKTYNINLDKSILIFDDGADINKISCRESSVEISTKDMASLTQTLKNILNTLDNSSVCIPPEVKSAKGMINNCMQYLDALSTEPWPIGNYYEKGTPTKEIINHLNVCGFSLEPSVLNTMLESFNLVLNRWSLFPGLKIANPEREVEKIIRFLTILKLISGDKGQSYDTSFYSLQITPSKTDSVTILKLVCSDSALAFKPFENAFSVIVASACLSPSVIYRVELGLNFKLADVSSQGLVKERHLFAYCLTGPNEVDYTVNFHQRDEPRVMQEVAQSIINLCKEIPNGVVVLFHSKVWMQDLLNFWKQFYEDGASISLRDNFDEVKHVISELDMDTEADRVRLIDEYKNNSRTKKGAMLLAFHRGYIYNHKLIGFMEEEMRGIIHVGIPYGAWFHEPAIVAKREYYHSLKKFSATEKEEQNLDWYTIEAFRLMNKSFFHRVAKNDYRVNIMLDFRMDKKKPRLGELLPRWIEYDDFECEGSSSKNFSSLIQYVKWFISAID